VRLAGLLLVGALIVNPGAAAGQARGLQRAAAMLAAAESFGSAPAPASERVEEPRYVTAVAGAGYDAGALHRWVLGAHYRDVWTLPVTVRVLDVSSRAGGLVPTRTGGGMQTRSLRFAGADGREYAFRSVDKDPSALLDPVLHGTVVDDLLQDGISTAHPYGALVVAPLARAAGVLHAEPELVVLPDDPVLGTFRREFAGMLGILEERPDENEGGATAFAGARKIIGTDKLTERLERGPDDRVDARAYLRARLVDFVVGDWDRHRDQWRWATRDDAAPRTWVPIPRDRDQAFSDFDGLAPGALRFQVPQFVRFGPEYGSVERLHWNARDIDRWFLAELNRSDWEEVGDSVVAALTDAVIDGSVRRMPPEVDALYGAELREVLRARRDGLPEAWASFYEMLSDRVDLRGTGDDDYVRIRMGAEAVTVSMASAAAPSRPYVQRTFDSGTTRELRVRLGSGDDRVEVLGEVTAGMQLRILGGAGDDRYTVLGSDAGLELLDDAGADVVEADEDVSIDRRPFDEWEWTPDDRDQPRDWGSHTRPLLWSGYESDVGAFLGGGARFERYGFRQRPFASSLEVRAGVAPAVGKARAEAAARWNRSNSPVFVKARAGVSQLDVLHYYGLGNATPRVGEDFHRADVSRAWLSTGVGVELGGGLELAAVAGLERTRSGRNVDRLVAALNDEPGAGNFRAVSVGGTLTFDPLAERNDVGHRLRVEAAATAYPGVLDAERAFARTRIDVAALLASSDRPDVALALRGGVQQVFGRFPWHHAAFLGGRQSLRGWDEERFAGDAAVHGGAELRVRLLRPRLVVPAAVGVFGFVDAGRVFVDGASPGGWHTGVGGGLFIQPVQQPYVFRLGGGTSPEGTKVYASLGLPY
jgi:hypothetical protein